MAPRKANTLNTRARRADAADHEVGRRVRTRRLEQQMSQTELADLCGVTFQQVQKYEKGTNRIGAGRLQKIAAALNVPITYFYGDGNGKLDAATSRIFELAQDRGAVRLLEAYRAASRAKRLALVATAEAMTA